MKIPPPEEVAMDKAAPIVLAAVCLLLLFLLVKIIKTPIKLALKLILNMISGLVLLFIFNTIGGFFDFTLEITWVNALVAGILGIPGIVLLIVIPLFI